MSYHFGTERSDLMQYTFNYVIERLLPDGKWVKLGGIMVAPSEEAVRERIEKQEKNNEIKIISITKR